MYKDKGTKELICTSNISSNLFCQSSKNLCVLRLIFYCIILLYNI